jgi:hypothetical protein
MARIHGGIFHKGVVGFSNPWVLFWFLLKASNCLLEKSWVREHWACLTGTGVAWSGGDEVIEAWSIN